MSEHVAVRVLRLDAGLPLPRYAQAGDAGADLPLAQDIVLAPGERALVGTGIAIELPPGYVGLVHPRSGLAARTGLTIVNAPGTVDSGYRGEIKVCLLNTDTRHAIALHRGDLVAQLVVQRFVHADFEVVDTLTVTERGAGGHGSSGGVSSWRNVASAPVPASPPPAASE